MTKQTSKFAIIASWASVLLWMLFIFYLSSQVAEQSNELSTGFTEVIIQTVEKVVPHSEWDVRELNNLLRKYAHFFTYLVLGVLVIHALHKSVILGWRSFFLALSVCVLYAISDEVHQLFVPGRGGQLKDVGIDSAGALLGISLYVFLYYIVRKRK